MNIYRVSCNGWYIEVKAASWKAAVSRGLESIGKSAGINSRKVTSVTVRAMVVERNTKMAPAPVIDFPPHEDYVRPGIPSETGGDK